MDNVPRSSFIPKQATSATPKQTKRKQVFSVFGVLGIVLLIGSVVSAGGVFAYTKYLENELASQKSALAIESQKFSDVDMVTVRNADAQLEKARELLDEHTSPSKIFEALEKNTKESVQYKTFSYERRPSGDVTLNITGVTNEFGKVSLQWTQYLEDVILADVVMTQIGLGEDSPEADPNTLVNFSLTANIDAVNIPYVPVAGLEEEMFGDRDFEFGSFLTGKSKH